MPQPNLAGFDDAFIKALADAPTTEAFLLIAKAKSQDARELVGQLRELPAWQYVEAVKVAHAALGCAAAEEEFLLALASASDGQALARAIRPLALVGSARSVKAIAQLLRTPLTIEIPSHGPGRSEKSARLVVLEALLYNFPDQPALYPNNINKDEDYRAAERFCMEKLGVTYATPPPPFFKYRDSPTPVEY